MSQCGDDGAVPVAHWHLVLASLGLLVLGLGFGRCIGRKKRRKLEKASLDHNLDTIMKSLVQSDGGGAGRLQFPLVVVRGQDFLLSGRLVTYEDLRRAGKLV